MKQNYSLISIDGVLVKHKYIYKTKMIMTLNAVKKKVENQSNVGNPNIFKVSPS